MLRGRKHRVSKTGGRSCITRKELTERKDVSDETDDAKVEVAVLDILATTEDQRDSHGAGITHRQEDDTHTGEGVVGGGRTEVDGTESNLNDHTQGHRIQGDVELLVDGAPPARTGDTAITSKGPGATRSGRDTTHAADNTEHEKRNSQAESTSRVTNGVLEDDRGRLRSIDEQAQLGHDEADWNQEKESGKKVDDDSTDHGLGDHDSRFADFLAETSQGC